MLSDRGVLCLFVVGLVVWVLLVTLLLAGSGGVAWLALGLVCESVALVMIVARRRVFGWLDRREVSR